MNSCSAPQTKGRHNHGRKFWAFFGSIWLIVGLSFAVVSLGALLFGDPADMAEPGLLWVFLPVGLALAAVGGYIVRRALLTAARDRRLKQSGIQLTATVTDVRRSPVDINRQARWHVHYRYEYSSGRNFEGRSRALAGDAVEGYRPGGEVLIKVDLSTNVPNRGAVPRTGRCSADRLGPVLAARRRFGRPAPERST